MTSIDTNIQTHGHAILIGVAIYSSLGMPYSKAISLAMRLHHQDESTVLGSVVAVLLESLDDPSALREAIYKALTDYLEGDDRE